MVHSENLSLSTSLESSRYELSTESLLARSSDEKLGFDSKDSPRACLRRSWAPSMTYERLRYICIGLHAALVALYGALLVVALLRFEQKVIVPLGRVSDIVSAGIVVTSQAFILLYASGLVVCTQQLALRRILRLRQTLTATHDTSQAWTGFGAAVLSLWRQTSVRAAIGGTSVIAAYLAGISILHITTTSLFSLQVFNGTVNTPISATIAYPNASAMDMGLDFALFNSFLNFADRMDSASILGLSNSTLYDVPQGALSSGEATVNATTFNVACGSIVPLEVHFISLPEEAIAESMGQAGVNVSFAIGNSRLSTQQILFPSYARVSGASDFVSPDGGAPPLGRNLPFSIYGYPVQDSEGFVSSVVKAPLTYTNGSENVAYNYPDWQLIGCTLSCTNHTAIVDVRTKQLIDVNVSFHKTESHFTSWQPNLFSHDIGYGEYNPIVDNVLDRWDELLIYRGDPQIYMGGLGSDGPVNDYFSRLMADAVSRDPESKLYLHDVENILASLTAAVYWAGTHFSFETTFSPSLRNADKDTTFYAQQVLMSRLKLSLPQLIVGGSTSLFILVLAVAMVRNTTDKAQVDGAGFLQIYWLLRDRPDLQHSVPHVDNPTVHNLRVAGMVRAQVDDAMKQRNLE